MNTKLYCIFIILSKAFLGCATPEFTTTPTCNTKHEIISRYLLINHGEYGIDVSFPTDAVRNKATRFFPGNLTEKGKEQMVRIGNEIVKNLEFSPLVLGLTDEREPQPASSCVIWTCSDLNNKIKLTEALNNSVIYVTSHGSRKCITSAQLIYKALMGHSSEDKTTSFESNVEVLPKPDFLLASGIQCQKLLTYIITEYLDNHPYLNKVFQENDEMLNYVFTNAGYDGTKFKPLLHIIANSLIFDKTYGIALPPWVNDTVYERIRHLSKTLVQNIGRDDANMIKIMIGNLLVRIIDSMKEHISILNLANGQTCFKQHMNIYVGIEATIVPILLAFNVSDFERPGFGAVMQIDLVKSNPENQYFVNIIYKDYEGGLYKSLIGRSIKFEEFTSILGKFLPSDGNEIKDYCASTIAPFVY